VDRVVIQDAALALFASVGYRATTMADIGAAVGVRGPSLYRHLRSKQDLLSAIMVDTMTTLIADQATALRSTTDPVLRVRRMVEAHVRFHAANRERAFVGNRELGSLEPDNRAEVLRLRDRYEHGLRSVIEAGVADGGFRVPSARLASYAILDMGIGVATWFRPDGPHSVDEVAYAYADHAIALLHPKETHE
jgi:AcrR family transcriptional regulator